MPGYMYSVLGFVGAVLVLLGFYRTSIGRWKNKSLVYELDNFLGAVFLIIYQMHFRVYISVVVNIIWAIVAFRGLTPFAERYGKKVKKAQSRQIRSLRRKVVK